VRRAGGEVIHPQAVVDPTAKIDAHVAVGAFSVIGPNVEIGEGTRVGPHVVIEGPTRLGRDNTVHAFCSFGGAPQHTGYKGEAATLEIGDRNTFREYITLNRGTAGGRQTTRLGNDNFFMAYVHVAHDCVVGDKTIFANSASLAGHVTVGDGAVLGGFTLVHQFCRIGSYCMTAAGSVFFKDAPPFVMAAGYSAEPHGLNVRGLKRHGFSEDEIRALRRAYKTVYKSGLVLDEALKQLDTTVPLIPVVKAFADFIRASERGIIR
jgi:UDP-N-acetylglucosamine acyltransferase